MGGAGQSAGRGDWRIVALEPATRHLLDRIAAEVFDGPIRPEALVAFLEDPRIAKTSHDATFALVAFARRGIAIRGLVGDSACASHLAQPSNHAPHDLPIVARHVLARGLREDDAVRGVGRARKRWAQVPVEKTAGFAAAWVDAAADVAADLAVRHLDPEVVGSCVASRSIY